jgi:hypothetical protein
MYELPEKFHKPLAAASKKLPEYVTDISNLFSTLADTDADKKELKALLAQVNNILNFAKVTMQKFDFVVDPNSACKQTISCFQMETYQDMSSGDPLLYEIDYRYLFSTAFYYAALLYYRDNFTKKSHNIPMFALMSFHRNILNADAAESDEPRFLMHKNAIIDTLTRNFHRNNNYLLGLSLPYLDQQFVIDSYNIYAALSKHDAAAFVAIIDRK